jgi:hypothetical protein
MILVSIVILSFIVALCGRNKKFGFWGYFFASLLLTPVIGLILVLASDKAPPKPLENKDT